MSLNNVSQETERPQMTKREPEVPLLMMGAALLLLALGFAAYEIMDSKFYRDAGDAWRDFWLPATTSMVASLVTFIVAFIFLRRGHGNDRAELAEQVAEIVMKKVEEQLSSHSAAIRNGAQVEALLLIVQRLTTQTMNGNDASLPETIKEPVTNTRRTKPISGNK